MQTKKLYTLQFAGLGLGEHKFEYSVTDKFFEALDYSEIKQGDVIVNVNLLKQSQMLVLEFEISGTVRTICDKCAADFDLPLNGKYKLVVKVGGHETGTDDDDIIRIGATEHQLELAQNIYEYIALSLPIKRLHPENKKGEPSCDKETLKKLTKYLIKEKKETKESSDPRWEGLKNIKLN